MKHAVLRDLAGAVGFGGGESMGHMHNSAVSINLWSTQVFILQDDSGEALIPGKDKPFPMRQSFLSPQHREMAPT